MLYDFFQRITKLILISAERNYHIKYLCAKNQVNLIARWFSKSFSPSISKMKNLYLYNRNIYPFFFYLSIFLKIVSKSFVQWFAVYQIISRIFCDISCDKTALNYIPMIITPHVITTAITRFTTLNIEAVFPHETDYITHSILTTFRLFSLSQSIYLNDIFENKKSNTITLQE